MAGLPFDELPAHVVGRGITADGRQVDLQRLFNTGTGREEDMIVENGVMSPAGSRSAGHTGPWIEQTQPQPQSPSPAQAVSQGPAQGPAQAMGDADPFVMLDQLRDVGLKQITPLFDSQEQVLKSQLDKVKGNLYRQYLVEAEGLNGLGLDATQMGKRHQQLKTKYKMAFTKATSEIEPQMQELTLARQKAVARVDAEHAERSLRIQQVQTMADRGLIDAAAAKQEQFGILGHRMSIERPEDATQRQQDRLQQLRPIYHMLTNEAAKYKKFPTGWRVYDDAAHDAYPKNPDKWYRTKATPEQAQEAADMESQLIEVGGQIKDLSRAIGAKPTMIEASPLALSPLGSAVSRLIKKAMPWAPNIEVQSMSDAELKRMAGVK